jgi:lysophospholipase L1-like esterase
MLVGTSGCLGDVPRRPVRLVTLGDSITLGTTDRNQIDLGGGFPGRLARRLGGRVTIVNRGVGGATASMWLDDGTGRLGSLAGRHLLEPAPDPALTSDVPRPQSIVARILGIDHPDVVLVLLGANDLLTTESGTPDEIADRIAGRIVAVRAQAARFAHRVLVGTVLPNRNGTEELRALVNRRLHAAVPDVLPLGERFEQAGGATLLADHVHPNAEGYEVLAHLVTIELLARDLVPRAAPAVHSPR